MSEQMKSVKMMGTTIDIMLDTSDDVNSTALIDTIIQQLHTYDRRFSANDSKSELMAVNRAAGISPIRVHSDLFHLIRKGKEHSLPENSYLNVALGPLIKMWHIGFSDAKKPTETEVVEVLQLTDPALIQLDEDKQTVFLENKGMEIDLGSLAKGYIADLIIRELKSQPIKTAYINLGGNFVSIGPTHKRENGCYRIGIQNPKRSRHTYLLAVDIQNQSVVTSGIYERKLESNNESFHHIFDAQTGYPIETEIASLTIISPASIDGEIWTTRLFGHSLSTILSTVETLQNIECIIITKRNKILYSTGLEGKLTHFSPR